MEALLGDDSENVATHLLCTDMRSFRLGCVCRVSSVHVSVACRFLLLMALWIGRDGGVKSNFVGSPNLLLPITSYLP